MKRFLIIPFLTILLITTASATNGDDSAVPSADKHPRTTATDSNIFGHVIIAGKGEHLPFATIILDNTTIGCTADATGHYKINNIPLGDYIIEVSAMGYKSVRYPFSAVANTSVELNFTLEEQSLDVGEIVVSATRNETNRRQASTVVNVASAKLFDSTAASLLSEAMSFQSGLRVENTCGNCGVTQLRINGLEGQYSQILLDSRPIFSSLAAVYGLDLMPVAMVERVEVIRGGGSALFGSNAIGGVVNIITKEPLRNTFSLGHTLNVLKGGSLDNNTSLGGAFVSDDYKMGAYIFGQVKGRNAYDRNGDGFSDITKLNSETLGFRAYYKTSAHSRLTAEYHHIHEFRRGGDNLDSAPHLAMICEQLDHNIDGGGLRFDLFPNERHNASIYLSTQGIRRASYFGADMNPNAYGSTKDFTIVGGGQYTFSYHAGMPASLTAGVEYNYNNLNDHYIATNRVLKQASSVYGLFAQNEWTSNKLNFLVGFRLDKHNMISKPIINPRASVRYSPIKDLDLRFSYSSGYRAPQTYSEDLHIDALNHAVSIIELAEDLRPEYSHSLNLSADYYHTFGKLQTNFMVDGFYTKLNDVFTLEKVREDEFGNTIKERRNASGARVGGITAEVRLGIPSIFDIQLGYTFQKSQYIEPEKWSEDVEAQRRMFRSPDHYGYLNSSFNITDDLQASLFGTFTGPMLVQHNAYTLDGVEYGDSQRVTESFWDLGAKVSYTFHLSSVINLEVNVGVKNIFDSYQDDLDIGAGRDSAYVYGPSLPRTFFFGVKLYM